MSKIIILNGISTNKTAPTLIEVQKWLNHNHQGLTANTPVLNHTNFRENEDMFNIIIDPRFSIVAPKIKEKKFHPGHIKHEDQLIEGFEFNVTLETSFHPLLKSFSQEGACLSGFGHRIFGFVGAKKAQTSAFMKRSALWAVYMPKISSPNDPKGEKQYTRFTPFFKTTGEALHEAVELSNWQMFENHLLFEASQKNRA